MSCVFIASISVALTGCSSHSGNGAQGTDENFLDSNAVKDEYVMTAEALNWPGTGKFLDYVNEPSGDGDFQRGVGEGEAVMAWNCAWAKEWLDVRGKNLDAEEVALDQYKAITETNTFSAYFAPDLQKYFHEAIEAAELGDPSLVQRDVEINCP